VPRTIFGDDSKPPPRPVFARFECDGDHGLFAPPVLVVDLFPGGAEAVDGWGEAVKQGWSVTPQRTLCPACPGGNGKAGNGKAGNGNGHGKADAAPPVKRGRGRPRKHV
jgi:hypothetical protein